METQRCYMCENPAITKEHVPPRCLFPEPKDVDGLDFKKNLITVPSCAIHNSAKSANDEFLMISLAGILNNNAVGKNHFYTKVSRALKRKEKDFLNKQILRNLKFRPLKTIDDKFTIAAIGSPNYDRLVDCFENISYGLFFHEFQLPFDGELSIFLGFIEYPDANMQTFKKLIKKRFEVEKDLLNDIKGDNQGVFYYQYCKPDRDGLIALKMVFYEQSEIYVTYIPKNFVAPQSLNLQLVKSGIKTIIEIGGQKFTLN